MAEIGIGIIGGGYMGKAHAVAHAAVGAIFNTRLRPRLEMVAASSAKSAARYRDAFGFCRAADDWQALVSDPAVDAVIIASPPETHLEITRAAASSGKPLFCEKPLGASVDDAREMTQIVEDAQIPNMIGFNYIRTPATQFARKLLLDGVIGDITWFRGEHTEDFYADPESPATWRATGDGNGAMGDLAPHMVNAALALMGPVREVMAHIETVHASRPGGTVSNDDQGQVMCRFTSGTMGHLFFSRTATGRKMGYIYEIFGTKGAIRFNQEDQNSLWLYKTEGPEAERGFRQILTGPEQPDYLPFCQGPGHGTGYQDQIIIEARDFLEAIADGKSRWPTFRDGLEVSHVIAAARAAHRDGRWRSVEQV
ncbi:MAG: Gfo/Idh/MocA family oxidoreductase [Pseudomonadota bacterium]